MKQKKTMRRKSFTMIEIVVVIVILVALASIATPLYMNHIKKANIGTAKTQIKLLEDALAGYKLDVGTYPSTEDGLQALMTNPGDSEKWNGPYIKPAVPKDPWGNDYVYTSPGEHGDFDLLSYGADGQPGGEGEDADITNYVAE